MTDPLPLDEDQALCDAATPGPWKLQLLMSGVTLTNTARGNGTNDAYFIARARSALPAYIAEVRRLRKVVAELELVERERVRKLDPDFRSTLVEPPEELREALNEERS